MSAEVERIRAALARYESLHKTDGDAWSAANVEFTEACDNLDAMRSVLAHIDQQEQRIAGYKSQADDDLLMIVKQNAEIALLRAALRTIAELHPDKDSDEGYNEWGQAHCFEQAQQLAQDALKETP